MPWGPSEGCCTTELIRNANLIPLVPTRTTRSASLEGAQESGSEQGWNSEKQCGIGHATAWLLKGLRSWVLGGSVPSLPPSTLGLQCAGARQHPKPGKVSSKGTQKATGLEWEARTANKFGVCLGNTGGALTRDSFRTPHLGYGMFKSTSHPNFKFWIHTPGCPIGAPWTVVSVPCTHTSSSFLAPHYINEPAIAPLLYLRPRSWECFPFPHSSVRLAKCIHFTFLYFSPYSLLPLIWALITFAQISQLVSMHISLCHT